MEYGVIGLSNGISQILTLHSSITAQPMLMKLETYNYCLKTTQHAKCSPFYECARLLFCSVSDAACLLSWKERISEFFSEAFVVVNCGTVCFCYFVTVILSVCCMLCIVLCASLVKWLWSSWLGFYFHIFIWNLVSSDISINSLPVSVYSWCLLYGLAASSTTLVLFVKSDLIDLS